MAFEVGAGDPAPEHALKPRLTAAAATKAKNAILSSGPHYEALDPEGYAADSNVALPRPLGFSATGSG